MTFNNCAARAFALFVSTAATCLVLIATDAIFRTEAGLPSHASEHIVLA